MQDFTSHPRVRLKFVRTICHLPHQSPSCDLARMSACFVYRITVRCAHELRKSLNPTPGSSPAKSFGYTRASQIPHSPRPKTMSIPTPTEGDFLITNVHFADGTSLPELRLHYTTLGAPRRNSAGQVANAVLILHGTGGSGRAFLREQFAGE